MGFWDKLGFKPPQKNLLERCLPARVPPKSFELSKEAAETIENILPGEVMRISLGRDFVILEADSFENIMSRAGMKTSFKDEGS